MELLVEGLPVRRIAEILGISTGTVYALRRQLKKKEEQNQCPK